MKNLLQFKIHSQPNDTTCGPTCLQAVYSFFGDELPLEQVIAETPSLEEGGTLAVMLGCHALRRGYEATIYTYNLKVFDPTWFYGSSKVFNGKPVAPQPPSKATNRPVVRRRPGVYERPAEDEVAATAPSHVDLVERLHAQTLVKDSMKLQLACRAYADFIKLGGVVKMHDLNAGLIQHYLDRKIPILTGLSSTYLYRCEREIGKTCKPDDIRGVPTGHFVVLCGFNQQRGTVQVADPWLANPLGDENYYEVHVERLICSIMLGVITYDANLLIIQPRRD